MKRTALKRSTKPMKRGRLKARRGKPRRSGRIHDPAYMARVRELPCCGRPTHVSCDVCTPCDGPVQAHHAGWHPMGRKADDDTCIPLCDTDHDHLHSLTGPFAGKTRDEVREWEDEEIAATRRALGYSPGQEAA